MLQNRNPAGADAEPITHNKDEATSLSAALSLEPVEEPAARDAIKAPPRCTPAHMPPEYVRVTLQRPRDHDGFVGRIAEGRFEVRGNNVVLTDMDGETIGGRQLLSGEDPAFVARQLLRARHAGDEFGEPIVYPTRHLA